MVRNIRRQPILPEITKCAAKVLFSIDIYKYCISIFI